MPAMAIAILGAVEALSIAKSIASKSRDKIDGNQEFIAQGLANMSAGFTSGIPGSGSFTRSAVNFGSGAKTRLAGVYSAIFIMATILIFAPYARFIPKTSLAAILMIIAYNMVDFKEIKSIWRATRSDAIVMMVTMSATLLLELEKAVFVGVFLSIALFMRKISRPQIKQVGPRSEDNRMTDVHLLDKSCPQISIYQIDGALFFGAMDDLGNKLSDIKTDGVHVVIIRMKGVHLVDATGIHALESFMEDLRDKNIKVIFTNVVPEVLKVFKSSGVINEIGEDHIQASTTDSIKFAYEKYVDKKECANCRYKVFKECQG
jgi:SulP family sulfate permease